MTQETQPQETQPQKASPQKASPQKTLPQKTPQQKALRTQASAPNKAHAVVRVKRVRSAIRRPKDQKATLLALGLGRMNRVRELPDTPSVRGMIAKVAHLVKTEE